MYGKAQEVPQRRDDARSILVVLYGAAKVYSYWLTVNYRESYGMFACNAFCLITSHRAGEKHIVTRKLRVPRAYQSRLEHNLYLGNLDANGIGAMLKSMPEAMWLMLQQEEADDYVVSTGESHSVRELLEETFSYVGLDWNKYVEIDPSTIVLLKWIC